ncbi:alpha/beta-hydrolase [Pleomassaria siparia CBS 279.74]|uniref:Alpha/beta-hydrolase n=1 Tax=Pleomassaria siparia CBS 279.74 TaxID=1314801 RepID=A0A6G1K6P1_9PLEO|nr:alpha/beta-hydrolase [Pleomassaria siparia CBS 279.74]
MSYDIVPKGATLNPRKFELKVPQQEVDEFYQLLKLSPLAPKTYENTRTDPNLFGVNHEWMTEAKNHWVSSYDWRRREDYINSFPNYKVQIKDDDGYEFDMHFAALFSEKQDAVPIAFLHGWPGSFLEFLSIMNLVRKKYSPQDLPYHVIVPSLPGYTLSSGPPLDKDFKTADIARIIDKLMVGLGFQSYMGQGGDIGSYTCRPLALHAGCKAVHLNFNMMIQPKNPDGDISATERKGLDRAEDFSERASAYAIEHGTRPATIGFVLQSSPIALFAWISEKFITWTDETPPLDDILDSVTLYWFTQSFPRCIYPYREYHGARTTSGLGPHSQPEYHFKKPFGYSYFPMELAPMPLAWVKASGDLVWYREHDRGGHFAAMEKPDVLLDDVEDFVKQVWK